MNIEILSRSLQALASKLAPGGSLVGEPQRLSGGASQETWAFAVRGEDGVEHALILRRRPDGMPSDPDRTASLGAEAALIRAAAAVGAPVPAVPHVCVPADGIGEAYVMERVEGETLGKRIVAGEAFAGVRPLLARRCGEVLAVIHSTPLDGLPPLATSDAQTELDKYEAIYRTSGARRPVFELAFKRLRRAAAAPPARTLVHGDFRNGNLMIHPDRGLVAVLDWELSHIGDPAEDLGWLCVNSWRFGEYRSPVGGFGPYADLLSGYEAAGGAPIALDRVIYWQTLGSLKWGVMCLIMYAAFASGADASVERAMIGRRVSETEMDLMNLFSSNLPGADA
jgi:aminoglycoside phosphotransferase (APT) family kinase protein